MSTQYSQDLSYRFIIVVHVERRVISRKGCALNWVPLRTVERYPRRNTYGRVALDPIQIISCFWRYRFFQIFCRLHFYKTMDNMQCLIVRKHRALKRALKRSYAHGTVFYWN